MFDFLNRLDSSALTAKQSALKAIQAI